MSGIDLVRFEAGRSLERIASMFKAGAKLTLLVRQPGHDDQDFMLTNDDLVEAAKAIERAQSR